MTEANDLRRLGYGAPPRKTIEVDAEALDGLIRGAWHNAMRGMARQDSAEPSVESWGSTPAVTKGKSGPPEEKADGEPTPEQIDAINAKLDALCDTMGLRLDALTSQLREEEEP
jgi:hypothetical protein